MEINRPKSALVVGAGYVGTRLAKALLAQKWTVFATTRSFEKSARLKQAGIRPVLFDLLSGAPLPSEISVDTVVICAAPDERDERAYENLYGQGIPRLMADLQHRSGVKRVLYTSSVGIYETTDGSWVDEKTKVNPIDGKSKALQKAERSLLESRVESVVLRLGGIYGPGRNRLNAVKLGRWSEETLDDYVNLIHVDDVVQSTLFFMDRPKTDSLLLVVDEKPVLRRDLYTWIAQRLKVTPPRPSEATTGGNKRCSSARLRETGYRFLFPTFVEGYENLLLGPSS